MTKLLHERLREYMKDGVLIDHESPLTQALEHYKLTPRLGSVYVESCFFKKLADEIEREYIPRPRYEDGEPVQFGDSAKRDFGTDDAKNIDKFVFYSGGTVDVCGSNGHFSTSRNGKGLKRLTPKILDADGVEIKVGDTVYNLEDKWEQGIVESIYKGTMPTTENNWYVGCFDNRGEFAFNKSPENLTHERPVFDANGERICKGDTVYVSEKYRDRCSRAWYDEDGMFFGLKGYEFGHPVTVSSMSDRDGYSQVYFIRGGCNCPNLALTHREPDSFEKLLERMEEYAQKNEGYIDGSKVGDFSKELRALIERGA